MTPTAITPGARRRTNGASASGSKPGTTAPPKRSAPGAPGHRRTIRPNPAPRRVSGPLRGRAGAASAPKRTQAPRLRRGRVRTRSARNEAPLGQRAISFVRGLPDHQLLDRVVRGRAWIAILGVMLAGIVAMQVEVLKLGATMGRAIEQGTALQSRNELLRESVASLADEQRIERLASGLGMVMPQPGGVGFLSAHRASASKAAAGVKAPDAAAFLSLLSSNGAVTPPATTATTSSQGAPGLGVAATTPAVQASSTSSTPVVSTPTAPAPTSTTPATPAAPATATTTPSSTGGVGSGTSPVPQGAATGATAAAATGGGASVTGG